MVQGKITEADTSTVWLGAIPSRPISDPPPSSPHFYAGCPSCHNPHSLSWLETVAKYAGLHTQWLGCIPSGLGHNGYMVNTDFFLFPAESLLISVCDNMVWMDSITMDFCLLRTSFPVPTLRTCWIQQT